MATIAVSSYEDALKTLKLWQTEPPSEDQRIAFADAAIRLLNDQDQTRTFEENVYRVGTMSVNINKAFNRVENGFWEMNLRYGDQFSEISGFHREWKSYQTLILQRWDDHLLLSSAVANESIQILDRFNNVYLLMVQNIKNDQDRLNAIQELQIFIVRSAELFRFIPRHAIDVWRMRITTAPSRCPKAFWNSNATLNILERSLTGSSHPKKIELENEATRLNEEIKNFQSEISTLNVRIKDTETALAVSGALLNIIGLIVSGSVLSSLQSERKGKLDELGRKQAQLADVNRKQSALPHLKSDFDGLKPDIDLICDKLILFGEIWSSVRSQSVQFREHLRGGMGAVGNTVFKKEIQLAREVCYPLQRGLVRYVTEIRNTGVPQPWP